jgi:hypothetical protein
MKIVWLNCCNPEKVFPPSGCDKCVVEISNSVWTQLAHNEWIYFVPTSENITILCMDEPPVDVIVSGIGELRKVPIVKALENQHYSRNIPC